jgi:hypothetical protein
MLPNFTGVWKLVPSETDFSFLPPPDLRVDTIVHEAPRLHIRTHQIDANGDITVDRDLTIGGEAQTIVILGHARMIRAFWDVTTLVVETNSKVSGKPRRIEDRWTIDAGAEWLTIARLHEQPGGAVHQSLRLQRL